MKLFSGYLSKHLYSIVNSSNKDMVIVPLTNYEIEFLNFFNIPYKVIEKQKSLYSINITSLKEHFN